MGLEDKLVSDGTVNLESNEICPVSVKLPPFWTHSPAIWFVQAEAQFSLARITIDQSKYNYVVASLPQDVAESIADLLQAPPTSDSYKLIKDTLINRHSLSVEKRLKQLLSDESIGDRKPSEFFRALQRLAGTHKFDDDLIRRIWCQRLPHLIKIALIPQKDETLTRILEVADQIWEAMATENISQMSLNTNSNFSTVPSQPKQLHSNVYQSTSSASNYNDNRYEKMESEIQEIKRMLGNLNVKQRHSRSQSRSRSDRFHSRSSSRKRFDKNGSMCWYHFKFNDKAQKCIKPCTFKSSVISKPSSN